MNRTQRRFYEFNNHRHKTKPLKPVRMFAQGQKKSFIKRFLGIA